MTTAPIIERKLVSSRKNWYTSGPAIVLYIAAAKLLLHLLTASRYGYFRDELYFLDCGEHLDFGYVDQPPMIAVVAWFGRHVLGGSLLGIRFLPALAGAAVVWLTGVITREIGGGRFAQGLGAFVVGFAPLYLSLGHLMTMNSFDPLIWMGCAYFVLRIIQTGHQRYWIWFGALAGLGLENKYAIAVFGAGIVIGVLLTEQRRALAHKWIWIGGGLAFLIFLPNLIWNIQHHWPFIELMHNIRASGRDIELGPLEFLKRQVLMMGPLAAPLWLGGVAYLLFSPTAKRFRPLAWAFIVTITLFWVLKGKDYYPGPVYPMMLAAGAVALERLAAGKAWRWIKPAYVVSLGAGAVALLPVVVPVLPVDTYLRYQAKLPFAIPRSEHSHMRDALPQHYADEFGWQEMTLAVARAYQSLPAEERPSVAIFANNFGEAGAIDFFGAQYELPKAIGGHQNYFLWGPRQYTGDPMIVLGDSVEGLRRWCTEVKVAAELDNPYNGMEHDPVLICRGFKPNLQVAWPKLKDWD